MAKNDIIPFNEDDDRLPAHLRDTDPSYDEWGSGQETGFPVLSIKSKVFHVCRGDDRELICRPDDPDEPATKIDIVVIRTHKGVARTYYDTQYEEGSQEKPACYSNDGITPADDAEEPQARKCATCPHSQWGSRITENGKKGKACSEVKRLAVAAPGQEDDAMLLRIPPTSLKEWDNYVRKLLKRGTNPSKVITRIGFDPTVSHQLLTFKPVGFINEEMAEAIAFERDSSVVMSIIGSGPAVEPPAPEGDDDDEPPAKQARRKKAEEPEPDEGEDDEPPAKPARRKKAEEPVDDDEPPAKPARRRRKPEPADDDDEPPAKPARRRQPAPEPEPKDEDDEPPAKPARRAKAKPEPDEDEGEGTGDPDLDDMLDGLFDD